MYELFNLVLFLFAVGLAWVEGETLPSLRSPYLLRLDLPVHLQKHQCVCFQKSMFLEWQANTKRQHTSCTVCSLLLGRARLEPSMPSHIPCSQANIFDPTHRPRR